MGIVAVNLVGDSADDAQNSPTNPTKADDPVVPRPSEELLAVSTLGVPREYPKSTPRVPLECTFVYLISKGAPARTHTHTHKRTHALAQT